jgi:predicted esterase
MKARRRLLGAVAGVLLLSTSASGCDWPAGTRYVHQVFANVDVTTNVPYRTTTTYQGQAITLRLDIYQPRGDTKARRPVMMWMHGGFWVGGDKSNMADWARDSARRGYVGVSVQYRLRSGIEDFSAAAMDAYDDVAAAAQWLKDNAATYRIDPNAIIAGGYSAGAINAMNLVFLPPDRGPAVSPVDGAISVAGMSFGPIRAGRDPVMMFNGTTDVLVPFATAEGNCNESIRLGNICRPNVYQGQGHEIGGTQLADILPKAHDFAFEAILVPKGYLAEPGPLADAA